MSAFGSLAVRRGGLTAAPTVFLEQHWPLIPVLLLAAVLRMGWPGLTEFKYDEARLSALALDWVHGGPLPLAGMPSSVGLSNPPVSVYLLALPYAVTDSPLGATLFVAALNVLAVAGCYALARRWWGPAAGWTSALLFAAAPWAVLYSRKLWAQNLLPPLVLLCIAAGYFGLVAGRPRWLLVLPVAVALTAQLHFSGLALAVWLLLMLVIFRRQALAGWRCLLAGIGLAGLTTVPYLLFQARHGLAEGARAAAQFGRPAQWDTQILHYAWLMTTGSEIHSLAGPQEFRAFLASLPPYEILFAAAGILAIAAVAWLAWRALRRGAGDQDAEQRAIAQLLLLWLVVPVLLYVRHSTPVYTHYLIVLFPAPFLAVGSLVAAVQGRRPRAALALAVLIAVIAVVQAAVFGALLQFVSTRATPGGFGTPLLYWTELADRVRAAPACDVRVLGDGTNPAFDETPAMFTVLLRDDGRIRYDAPSAGDTHHSALLVLMPALAPAEQAQWTGQSRPVLALPLRPGEAPVTITDWPDIAGARPPAHAEPEPVRFANGVTLVDRFVQAPRPGERPTGRVYLQWELPGEPGSEVHVFNHIVDAAGQPAGQADTELCPRAGWRAGTKVWTWFDVPPEVASGLLAGSPGYTVRSGLYTYPEIVNVPVATGPGQAIRDAVEWILAW